MPPGAAKLEVIDVVTAFYRVLLMRDPDPGGLEANLAAILDGNMTIEEILLSFCRSAEFQANGLRLLETYGTGKETSFFNDHSQYGEFGIIMRHWINESARHRLIVDVGARGRDRSNSYDLLRAFGWRAVLVEANPALIESIRSDFAGLDIQLVNAAVSDYDGTATFHLGINNDVSSLNPDAALLWGSIQGEVSVTVRRLPAILRDHAVPPDFDLLSLDIEGEDIKVLNDLLASGYHPRWIIIEASDNFKTRSLDDLPFSDAVKLGYRMVGQTHSNLILKSVM